MQFTSLTIEYFHSAVQIVKFNLPPSAIHFGSHTVPFKSPTYTSSVQSIHLHQVPTCQFSFTIHWCRALKYRQCSVLSCLCIVAVHQAAMPQVEEASWDRTLFDPSPQSGPMSSMLMLMVRFYNSSLGTFENFSKIKKYLTFSWFK